MAQKDEQETAGEQVMDVYHRIEHFFEENAQKVAIGGGVLAVVIIGLVFLFAKWLPERNVKAQREMYLAEMAFAQDSFNVALNGNGLNAKGFLEIQKKYSFTKAANLCNYYIGISYLNQKKFADATTYLDKFSTNDPILGAAKLNALGDAYSEQNKTEDATNYYKKAAAFSDNEQFTPYYLMKLGMYYETLKKNTEAKETYQTIKDKYPNSEEGRNVDIFLARVSN